MVGGLINIISYGISDLFLSGNPEITFFKILYRRYTNFAKESIIIPIGDIKFEDEVTVEIPKIGDLISNTYLQLVIPEIKLLRTDTASNLTSDEITTLTTPRPSPFTSEQIAIQADYPIINIFMAINMNGYRVAVSKLNIQNITSTEYGNAILNVLTFNNSEDINYNNALNRALTYEESVKNYSNIFYLTKKISDIKYILTTIQGQNNGFLNYTIPQLFQIIKDAKDVSIKVKEYYFKKVKEYKDTNIINASNYAKFAWINNLGYAILDRIDINIGGQRIDRHYGDWMNIWKELTSYTAQDDVYNNLIGNVKELTTFDSNAKPQYNINIPLSFWFCNRLGLAFPLIALQYSVFSITFKLNKFEKCAYLEKLPTDITGSNLSEIWDNMGYTINANLLIDYIYLDKLERRRFAQSAHEYLIETIQQMSLTNLAEPEQSITLDFTGPCKELIWYAQKTAYVNEDSYSLKLPFNYSLLSNYTNNPIEKSQLLISGHKIFDLFNSSFYNYLQPYEHHRRTPIDGINVYSFCLFPEEHQPSGTINFSVLTNPMLNININKNMFKYNSSDIDITIVKNSDQDIDNTTNINIVIYTIKYDILRIIGGMAGFAVRHLT